MRTKKAFIFIGILVISLCLIFYITNTNSSKHTDTTIDLKGANNFWKASLNIHMNYDSELIIQPQRDDFNVPPEINVDIIVNDKCVYTDGLKYIPNSNKELFGNYFVRLNSNDYFTKDTKNIDLIIKYNNERSSKLLN